MGVVADGARWARQDRLADSLVRDAGNIVDLQSIGSLCGIQVFAAKLQAARTMAPMLVGVLQQPLQCLVALVVVWITLT